MEISRLPDGWSILRVSELADKEKYSIVGGPFGSKLTRKDYVDYEGVPVSRGSNLILGERFFKDEEFVYVSDEKADSLISNTAYPGDIILTQRGTIGQVTIIPKNSRYKKYILSQNQMKIKVDQHKVDPFYFLYYFLSKSVQDHIQRISIGGVIPGFNLTQFKEFKVVLPPISYQSEIAKVLSSLDDKIDLSHQMSNTLESIAQALFKSWFVDFDPVIDNALASGKKIPEELREKAQARNALGDKCKPLLPEAIRSLFPNEFTYSDEMGWIPLGWEIMRLGDATSKFATGLNPRKNFVLGEGDNYYVTIKNMRDKDVVLDDKCDRVTDEALLKINARADLQAGDSLFSGIGTIGRVFYLDSTPNNWNTSESVFSVRADGSVMSSVFLYRLLLSHDLQGYAQQLASGSVQKGIRMSALKDYKFVLPGKDILNHADNEFSGLLNKWKMNNRENKNLASVRDTLLPKLLSGELRIPDAEEMMKEVN